MVLCRYSLGETPVLCKTLCSFMAKPCNMVTQALQSANVSMPAMYMIGVALATAKHAA